MSDSDIKYECPEYCGGCSCHIHPPCSHCVDHGVVEEEEDSVCVEIPKKSLSESGQRLVENLHSAMTGATNILQNKCLHCNGTGVKTENGRRIPNEPCQPCYGTGTLTIQSLSNQSKKTEQSWPLKDSAEIKGDEQC